MKNIAFVWWWTWWHIFPIKSLIEYLYDNNANYNFNSIYWIWEKNSLEESVAKGFENKKWFKFISIFSWKLRRYITFSSIYNNFIDIFKVIFWFFQSIYLIKKNQIDIIFCKWWYVALPFVFAWKFLWKKIFVHESDTVPWLVNKLASRFSAKNFCGFEWVIYKCVHTWQIISNDLLKFEKLDLKLDVNNKINVVVMWGSQWARVVYEALLNILEKNFINYNFFIVLGLKNIELKERFSKHENVQCFEFLSQWQMWGLLNICDVAITRGSATSLDEQKHFWLKLIIVPLPYTWWNHQYYNGLYYKDKFWDFLIMQDENLEKNLEKDLNVLINYKKTMVKITNFDDNKKLIFDEIFLHHRI